MPRGVEIRQAGVEKFGADLGGIHADLQTWAGAIAPSRV
jgi:hypothetical protein